MKPKSRFLCLLVISAVIIGLVVIGIGYLFSIKLL